MSRRLAALERAREDREPVEPWAVHIPHYLSGTPEALAEEAAFKAAHPGKNLVLVQIIDGRKPQVAA